MTILKLALAILVSVAAAAASAQDFPNRPIKMVVPYAAGVNPHLYAKLPYDPAKDFTPVSLIATSELFLTEALKLALGLDIVHVPYKGTGQAVPALLGGQVALLYSALPSIESQVKAGKLKLLALSTAKRSAQVPEVPTVAELGIPGYHFTPEIGVVAPTGTPAAIVQKLSAEIAKAVTHAETAKRFLQLGIYPVGSSPEAYAAVIRSSYEKYGQVVKTANVRID